MSESNTINVIRTISPPSRLEGGGFQIKDIMSGLTTPEQDPFLVATIILFLLYMDDVDLTGPSSPDVARDTESIPESRTVSWRPHALSPGVLRDALLQRDQRRKF